MIRVHFDHLMRRPDRVKHVASRQTLHVMAALVAVYVLAIARAVTVPFQPFIYFRF